MEINNLKTKLQEDLSLFSQGLPYSDNFKLAPKMNRTTGAQAKQLAYLLFPPKDMDNPEERKNSYIQYTQSLAKLKKNFPEPKEEKTFPAPQTQYHQARYCLRTYKSTKDDMTISDQIANPKAMPVDQTPIHELQSYFNVLKNKLSVSEGNVIICDRGALFRDGRMDLCKQVVGPLHIGNLMESLIGNTQVSHFLLGNNVIGEVGALAIARYLSSNTEVPITTWYLAGNDLNAECMSIIMPLLVRTNIKQLWLKRNPIGPKGMKHIAEFLKQNNTIEVLDLQNVGMFDEGVQYLVDGLQDNASLHTLYIDCNGLTKQSTEYLAYYFKTSTSKNLRKLFISMNRIGDEGAVNLAVSLNSYPLDTLVVCSNRIGYLGLQQLLDFAHNNPSLQVLDIGYYKATADVGELPNCFRDDQSVNAICSFLEKNTSLRSLSLYNTFLDMDDIEKLCNSIAKNTSLISLNVGNDSLVNESRYKLLLKNIELSIKMNANKLGIDNLKEYAHFLKHGKDVWVIASMYRNK